MIGETYPGKTIGKHRRGFPLLFALCLPFSQEWRKSKTASTKGYSWRQFNLQRILSEGVGEFRQGNKVLQADTRHIRGCRRSQIELPSTV